MTMKSTQCIGESLHYKTQGIYQPGEFEQQM